MTERQPQPRGPRRLRFAGCELDVTTGTLSAPDGAATVLRPKTAALLQLLLRDAGRVVPRVEIMGTLWSGRAVSDDSITQCVVELRKAMGAQAADMLRTVTRHGYLLEAEVVFDLPSPMPAATQPAGEAPFLAVLPFRRGVAEGADPHLAEGLAEGIIHVLAGLDRLLVASRGSARAAADRTTDPREVGALLGVRHVLQGGVRRIGDRIRITAELTDAETGVIVRTERHEGPAAELSVLQGRLAEQVAIHLVPRLRAPELARALRRPPVAPAVQELVLRAVALLDRGEAASVAEALALLGAAAAADPDHPLAFSLLASGHAYRLARGWATEPDAEAAAAQRAADAALDLDPADGPALAVRGLLLCYVEQDFTRAGAVLDAAVQASPSNALAWTCGAALRCWLGRPAEALDWAGRGVRLARFDRFAFLHEQVLALAHYVGGDFDQAIAWAEASARSHPRHAPSWRTLAASLVGAGRIEQARGAARRVMELDPGFGLGRFTLRTPLRPPVRDRFVADLRVAGLPE